jgi:hypothetical protein
MFLNPLKRSKRAFEMFLAVEGISNPLFTSTLPSQDML